MLEAVRTLPLFLINLLLIAFEADLIFTIARVEVLVHFLKMELANLADVGSAWLSFVLGLISLAKVMLILCAQIGAAASWSTFFVKLASLGRLTFAGAKQEVSSLLVFL